MKLPAVLLGMPTTAAWPFATVSGPTKSATLFTSHNDAAAPLAAGVTSKRTTPPLTGSSGLLAATSSVRSNAAPMAAVCAMPPTGVSVKPWLSKAPMSVAPTRPWPR